jgi:hypothetical protein
MLLPLLVRGAERNTHRLAPLSGAAFFEAQGRVFLYLLLGGKVVALEVLGHLLGGHVLSSSSLLFPLISAWAGLMFLIYAWFMPLR